MVEKLKAVFAAFALLLGLTLSSCESCNEKKGKPDGKTDVPSVTDAVNRDTSNPTTNPTLVPGATPTSPQAPTTNPTPAPQTPKQIAEVEVRIAIKKVVDATKNVNEKAQFAGKKDKDIAEVMVVDKNQFEGIKNEIGKWIASVNTLSATMTSLSENADKVIAGGAGAEDWHTTLCFAENMFYVNIDKDWEPGGKIHGAWRGHRGHFAKNNPTEFAGADAAIASFRDAKTELGNAVNELKDAMTKWISA
jgi:hypothetical protein